MKLSKNRSVNNQFTGFLKIPNLFSKTKVFSVESFETSNYASCHVSHLDFKQLQKHKYLGKRAEFFMKSYLEQINNFHSVHHSLQVRDDKITLGELDFLFFDCNREKWIHLELICKFYVYRGNQNHTDIESWIGPNLKDRLDYKVHKLKTHQLKICKSQQAKRLIESLNIDAEQIETNICYKAKLYLPLEDDGLQLTHTNADCIQGKFYNFETFKAFKHSEMLFYIPQKREWVGQPEAHYRWYDFNKAEQLLKPKIHQKRSQMLWRKTKTGDYFEDFVVWW